MLERVPEDKLGFLIQIIQGMNGLFTENNTGRTTTKRKEEKSESLDFTMFCDGALGSIPVASFAFLERKSL